MGRGERGERGERCDWWPRRVVVWIVDTHDQNVVFRVPPLVVFI